MAINVNLEGFKHKIKLIISLSQKSTVGSRLTYLLLLAVNSSLSCKTPEFLLLIMTPILRCRTRDISCF